jgi:large subunit ribosomal protein L21
VYKPSFRASLHLDRAPVRRFPGSSKRAPQRFASQGEAMYAIVNINGTQTRVSPDAVVEVPAPQGRPRAEADLRPGDAGRRRRQDHDRQAVLKGASLVAEVVEHFRGEKIKIFKYKRRHDFRKRAGHRSDLTRLRVASIQA